MLTVNIYKIYLNYLCWMCLYGTVVVVLFYQRTQPEAITFLAENEDSSLYSIPGKMREIVSGGSSV